MGFSKSAAIYLSQEDRSTTMSFPFVPSIAILTRTYLTYKNTVCNDYTEDLWYPLQ